MHASVDERYYTQNHTRVAMQSFVISSYTLPLPADFALYSYDHFD